MRMQRRFDGMAGPMPRILVRVLLMACITLSTANLARAELVGYWNFEDNVTDQTGKGNDGTIMGDPLYVTNTPVAVAGSAKAMEFNTSVDIEPYAEAGKDQYPLEGETVILGGLQFPVPGVTYNWQQTSGLQVTLSDADTPTPSFVAPATTPGEVLEFTYTVSVQGESKELDALLHDAIRNSDVFFAPAASRAVMMGETDSAGEGHRRGIISCATGKP